MTFFTRRPIPTITKIVRDHIMMASPRYTLAFLLSLVVLMAGGEAVSRRTSSQPQAVHWPGHYTNDWVVRLSGSRRTADALAAELGYQNLGPLMGFPDTYLMRRVNHPKRSKREAGHHTRRLSDDNRVVWAEQQMLLKREKRGLRREKRYGGYLRDRQEDRFNDDLWPHQWYLHDTRIMDNLPELDMKVIPVWDMGYTGKGVVVTIMDDGLEWNHTDIGSNYDPEASWDTNDNDPDPFPRYDKFDSNSHGTRCAGEIAMKANNEKCGVGVAYNARVGGIKMLDGDVSDAVESVSLAFHIDHIDVFSASWGPSDDGMTVDGPKRLAVEALEKGIFEGRGGKGVIYVWAAGNGGGSNDNCNCDGYTSSIYTLSIGSASQQGQFPWYGEKCASTMAATFSSGAYRDQKISTTDLHDKCTIDHTGTSAAAPLAAGVVALVLEANPKLTWRDMQYLVSWTSDYQPLKNNRGWKRNGAGLMYNSRFGFGLMDAYSLVKVALDWTTVPSKSICRVDSSSLLPQAIVSGGSAGVHFLSKGCKGTDDEVNYVEHVEVTVSVEYTHRGALDVFLSSPAGSVTMLLSRRELDTSSMGFKNWTFLTVHLWGERTAGDWTLLVRDKNGKDYRGALSYAQLTLHGTKVKPSHMVNGSKTYPDEEDAIRTIDKSKEYEDSEPDREQSESLKNRLDGLREADDHDNDLDWVDLMDHKLRSLPEKTDDFESYADPSDRTDRGLHPDTTDYVFFEYK